MTDPQRELQASRTTQHGSAAAAAAGDAPASAPAPAAPDAARCIVHIDVDCFYAQCEEHRNPALRGRPLGVTQKYLLVTCNYAARQQGVEKMMSVADARRRCPHLALISGEDLTPYRAASKQILGVLQRFGAVERLGLDEFYLDATPEAQRRLAALRGQGGGAPPPWHGHVHTGGAQLQQDSRHRPMDLRAVAGAAGGAADAAASPAAYGGASWEALLRVGSAIAAEARSAVRAEAGYRTSAGIACNKLLAKMCSGLHKPDDQTILPPPEAAAFVAPLPVRALTGVGYKTEQELQGLGVSTVADLRALSRQHLVSKLGERTAALLHAACWGKDPSPVQERGPPKSVTVEDSFASCRGWAAAEKVVRVLAPDLLARLQEEQAEQGRRPATLAIKWRHAGASNNARSSASGAMPQGALAGQAPQDERAATLVAGAMALLRRSLREPFDLTLINLGATGFSEGAGAAAGTRSIADLLAGASGGSAGRPAQQPQQQQQQQQAQRPVLQQACAAPQAAAAASAHQRRSYSSAPPQALLLPKRLERELREQGGHTGLLQQPAPAAGPPPGSSGLEFGERGGEEDGDNDLWGDLAGLAGWRADGGRKLRSPQAAAPVAMAGSGGRGSAPPQAAQPASGGLPPGLSGDGGGGRVIIHADVDSFYVAVERLDDPSLAGKPVAVQQSNAGGFVAVSYEARAAGIRCGDGAGAAGRAAVPHLVLMQAASLADCGRRCPGLVVRPMRTDRYRAVAQQILAELRTFAPDGQVEKTSYDDFYMDISAACTSAGCPAAGEPPPPGLLVLPRAAPHAEAPPDAAQQWERLPADLRRGVHLAAALRSAVKQRLCLTLSCGVARSKLLARLASPCSKPDGLAVVPPAAALAFMAQVPLQEVPQLRGKFGAAVVADLGVTAVGQLAGIPRQELVRRYGETRGAFLALLPLAQDDSTVRERGPQKSLAAERSFPPLPSEAAAASELAPLARTLLARAAKDAREHCRLPSKLVVSYRQSYGSNPRSKSAAVPPDVLCWLQAVQPGGQPALLAEQQGQAAAAQDAAPAASVVAAALVLLRPAVAPSGWQLTRLAVALCYDAAGDSSVSAGQTSLAAFVRRRSGSGELEAEGPPEACAAEQQQQEQQQEQPPVVAEPQLSPQRPRQAPAQPPAARPPPAARQPSQQSAAAQRAAMPATYRNAEALAITELFGRSTGSGLPAAQQPLPAELSSEERASLELALQLQQEEAAAAVAARKRAADAPPAGNGRHRPKQQPRRGCGPLDAFVTRGRT